MKSIISIVALLIAVYTTSAQGTFQAMLNYAATTQSGGTPVSSPIYSSINGPIGWTFVPSASVQVTALGAFDYLMPGQNSLLVGLWDGDGNLLASKTIRPTSAPTGQSRYESITPLLLLAGQTYYVAAYSASGVLNAVVVTPDSTPNGYATMSPEIQLGKIAYDLNSAFSFPGTTEGNAGYAIIAPNFEFQVVPEPGLSALLALGMAGWLVTRRGAWHH